MTMTLDVGTAALIDPASEPVHLRSGVLRSGESTWREPEDRQIRIDGSTHLAPLADAVAGEFCRANPGAGVRVRRCGTRAGFESFADGQAHAVLASRPIRASEARRAIERGLGFIELPVAFDSFSVFVYRENEWAGSITMPELQAAWRAIRPARTWRDLRPEWPDRPLRLRSPGLGPDLLKTFLRMVDGDRPADWTAAGPETGNGEDEEGGGPDILGVASYAQAARGIDPFRTIPVDGGDGPVAPGRESVSDGRYPLLARPLFLYVFSSPEQVPGLQDFVRFFLRRAIPLAEALGFIPLSDRVRDVLWERFERRHLGAFLGLV